MVHVITSLLCISMWNIHNIQLNAVRSMEAQVRKHASTHLRVQAPCEQMHAIHISRTRRACKDYTRSPRAHAGAFLQQPIASVAGHHAKQGALSLGSDQAAIINLSYSLWAWAPPARRPNHSKTSILGRPACLRAAIAECSSNEHAHIQALQAEAAGAHTRYPAVGDALCGRPCHSAVKMPRLRQVWRL